MDRNCKIRCGINGKEDSKKQNNGFVVTNYDYDGTKEQFTQKCHVTPQGPPAG